MSRKVAKIVLNQHRKSVLAFQNVRDGRLRRVSERQQLDQWRREAARQELEKTSDLLRQARARVATLRNAARAPDSETEIAVLERHLKEAQRQYDQDYDAFLSAGKQFRTEIEAWAQLHAQIKTEVDSTLIRQARMSESTEQYHFDEVKQAFLRLQSKYNAGAPDEVYQGGAFDAFRRQDAHSQLDEIFAECERIERLAAGDQANTAGGRSAKLLDHARAVRAEFDTAPVGVVPAETLRKIDHLLEETDRLVQAQDAAAAAHLLEQIEAEHATAHARVATWRQQLDSALVKLEEAEVRAKVIDREFLGKWAPEQVAALDTLLEQTHIAREAGRSKGSEVSYDSFDALATSLDKAIEDARTAAETAHDVETEREEMTDGVINAFNETGYHIKSVQRANPDDPRSDIIIDVIRGAQDASVCLYLDDNGTQVQVEYDMTDGINGTDCVADLHEIGAALEKQGNLQEVIDYGDIPPERLPDSLIDRKDKWNEQQGSTNATHE